MPFMAGLSHRQTEILNLARATGRVMVEDLAEKEALNSSTAELPLLIVSMSSHTIGNTNVGRSLWSWCNVFLFFIRAHPCHPWSIEMIPGMTG